MYLLLVDPNFMAFPELEEMIGQTPGDTDIVNCYSEETLLKIAEKLSPAIVVIDFDLVKGDLANLLDGLRLKEKEAHVMALINPDYYDRLYEAIELGGIDDYMVKPIQKEDFLARVQIAFMKKKQFVEKVTPVDKKKESKDDKYSEAGHPSSESYFEEIKAPSEESAKDHFDFKPASAETGRLNGVGDAKGQDEGDLSKLFEDVDSIFATSPGAEGDRDQIDQEAEPIEKIMPEEPAPDVVRPADEFLGQTKPSDSSRPVLPLAEDKKFFDDLFEDEAGGEQGEEGDSEQAEPVLDTQGPKEWFNLDFDEGEARDDDQDEQILPGGGVNHPEIQRRSSLPGKSADDFLYGENEVEDDILEQTKPEDKSGDKGMEENEPQAQEEIARSKKQKKVRSRHKGFFSIFGNILFVVILLVMAGLSFFLIQSRITGGAPQIAGYQIYIVLSDDMSPEIRAGSLAFVSEIEPQELAVGDIITFQSPDDPSALATQRLVEVKKDNDLGFVTRGDAGNTADISPVPSDNVVGKVTGSVPYAGYPLDFVQTSQGLILLIFIPGVLIIAFEVNKIIKHMSPGKDNNRSKGSSNHNRLAESER